MFDAADVVYSRLSSQVSRRDRKIKIDIRIWFIFQREMPPFTVKRLKAVPDHGILKKHPVFILLVRNKAAVWMRQFTEKIKRATHIHFFACAHVQKCKINGAASAVA